MSALKTGHPGAMIVEQFVKECRHLVHAEGALENIRAAMARLVEHRDELANQHPAPIGSETVSGESDELFEDESISIMIVHAPPGVVQPPHDHLMSVVIGGFRGAEHQRLYRRTTDGQTGGDGPAIEPAGTSVVRPGDVFSLGTHGVHAIEAQGTEWSSAVHVYLGQLSAVSRSLFHPDTFVEEPLDLAVYDNYCRDATGG